MQSSFSYYYILIARPNRTYLKHLLDYTGKLSDREAYQARSRTLERQTHKWEGEKQTICNK